MTAAELYGWYYDEPPRVFFSAALCSMLSAWACTRVRLYNKAADSTFGAGLVLW